MINFESVNNPSLPIDYWKSLNSSGATIGCWYGSKWQQTYVIEEIKAFVKGVDPDFHTVLRLLQDSERYRFLRFIISFPEIKEDKYKGLCVIGLFYEDMDPMNGIRFKQDFILSLDSGYIFILGDSWVCQYPKLSKFKKYIWNYSKFNKEIANGQLYQHCGRFNHHYKSVSDLPLEIRKYYERRFLSNSNLVMGTSRLNLILDDL